MNGTQLDLRRVFGAFPTGVAVLAALIDGHPMGMAADSFVTVSLDPPLVSVCVAHSSTTWPALRSAPRIGISVLGAEQEKVSRRLARRGVDRFDGVAWREIGDGCVLLEGTAAWFDCSVSQEVRAGDHDIVVFDVHDLDTSHDAAPLVFYNSNYRRLR